jgi:hypothetical protein
MDAAANRRFARGLVQELWARLSRRVVAQVTSMSTVKLNPPLSLFILVKAKNRSFHLVHL